MVQNMMQNKRNNQRRKGWNLISQWTMSQTYKILDSDVLKWEKVHNNRNWKEYKE